jgi:superoxide reductase
MSDFAGLIKTADWKAEKHVPVIEAPDAVSAADFVTVTVSVGKEIRHPNTTEHFINWIELFFKPEDGPAISLGRADFSAHGESAKGANQGPAYTDPVFATRVQLKASGTLQALSYCNIHGLWQSSKAIAVKA